MNIDPLQPGDLQPDERLLWVDRPAGPRRLGVSDLFQGCFGLCFAGFALFWMVAAVNSTGPNSQGAPFLFPLFGLPFLLVGLFIAFGKPLYDRSMLKKTIYALTDQRVIRVIEGNPRKISGFTVDRVIGIDREIRSDGTGSIYFQTDGIVTWDSMMPVMSSRYGNSSQSLIQKIGFVNIPDAANVAAIVDRTTAERRALKS